MTSSLTDKLFDNKMMAVSQNWIDWQFILVLFNAASPPPKENKTRKDEEKKNEFGLQRTFSLKVC